MSYQRPKFRRGRRHETILERMSKISPEEIERLIRLKVRVPLNRAGPSQGIFDGATDCQVIEYKRERRLMFKVRLEGKRTPAWIFEEDLDLFSARLLLYQKK